MLEKFKKSFAPFNGKIRLNNAGLAPISLPARQATELWSKRLYEEGDTCIFDGFQEIENTRKQIAQFLHARPEEVAFFGTTATAISQVALGFPLKPGDEILTWDQEYPSNFYPWMVAAEKAGAKFVLAPSTSDLQTPAEVLLKHITPKTKIVAFSWVQYRTGATADLKAITNVCRANGIFTCADIIQGAGVLPFDFADSALDAACGGGHKWMFSPLGVGYLVVKQEHVAKLTPLSFGAMSFGGSEELSHLGARLRSDIGRFEPGGKNILEIAALGASLKLLNDTGIEVVHQEALRLAGKLQNGLLRLGYAIHSKGGVIVNFAPTTRSPVKTINETVEKLRAKSVSFGNRPPGIRLSPHAFVSDNEIEMALEILK